MKGGCEGERARQAQISTPPGNQKEVRWDKMASKSFKTRSGSGAKNYIFFISFLQDFGRILGSLLAPIFGRKINLKDFWGKQVGVRFCTDFGTKI